MFLVDNSCYFLSLFPSGHAAGPLNGLIKQPSKNGQKNHRYRDDTSTAVGGVKAGGSDDFASSRWVVGGSWVVGGGSLVLSCLVFCCFWL